LEAPAEKKKKDKKTKGNIFGSLFKKKSSKDSTKKGDKEK